MLPLRYFRRARRDLRDAAMICFRYYFAADAVLRATMPP